MSADPDLASLAALITEPARAAMLVHLLDGRSWTAAELGKVARVRASTASVHLQKLLKGQLIHMSPSGRHRYFRLARPDVAQLMERFACHAQPAPIRTPGEKKAAADLRRCRLCYDHLAGSVGVAITRSMLQQGWLREAEPWFHVTTEGRAALDQLGIEAVDGRTCMDWSERVLHLAGPLGTRIATHCIEQKWLQRDPRSRALRITPIGAAELRNRFGAC